MLSVLLTFNLDYLLRPCEKFLKNKETDAK